jgi:hypothetical protein
VFQTLYGQTAAARYAKDACQNAYFRQLYNASADTYYKANGDDLERQYLLINDGDGQINYEKFVYDCISEERALLYLSHSRLPSGATGEVTWTGLFFPEIERMPPRNMESYLALQIALYDLDDLDRERDLDNLDRERDYREQQRERVGRGQLVQHEGRKKMRTQARTQARTRIGCKGRVLHLRPRRGGKNAGTGGAALALRELLADLFC